MGKAGKGSKWLCDAIKNGAKKRHRGGFLPDSPPRAAGLCPRQPRAPVVARPG